MRHRALQDPHPSHQVILESDTSVVVLGKGKEFYLVRLNGSETVADALDVAWRNDYTYCGVIGVKDGVPKAQIEPDPDSLLTMVHAGLAFAAIIAEDLKKHQMDAAFCERLYALPDTRPAH